ncbi:MAG: tRNA/rRNA methyltransferase SpoU [Parcubacteria group bacterium Gr01-1014_20]|nr:MAG: tRNA/rRNA methyltransferase SpoU [Parcubacteria group bacterium Gr01-1014_20]
MNLTLILHNIRSVYNVASIFRTADGAGVSKIYLVGVTPTPLDRFKKFRADFAKVALGAERTVTWEKRQGTSLLLKELKSDEYDILAVEQDKRSVPYYSYKLSRDKRQVKNKKIALVLGEETKGLPKLVLDKCDKILEIPMRGKKESLNVSVAAGIVVYNLLVER